MGRQAVPQEVFDAVVDNSPAVLFPRWVTVAMAKTIFRVADDGQTREKFGYAAR